MIVRTIRKLRSALLGAAAGALVLTTTTALAGSGVGGVFNLGQVNTVDAQTSLTGNPGGSPLLKATTLGTAAAVRGIAANGIGTNGISTSGVGQQGLSNSGIGTLGTHGNTTGISPGVQGETNSTDPAGAGVVGKNNGGGPGVKAIVNAGAPPLSVNSSVKVANLNADLLDGLDSAALPYYWKLGGNAGTTPGTNFLGTTDNTALELKVNGQRALRIQPDATSPNLIGGFPGNVVDPGHLGSVIAGGGASGNVNHILNDYGFIGAGLANQAGSASGGGAAAVVAGSLNIASGGSAFIGAGAANQAISNYAFVGAGQFNAANGAWSSVSGGYGNTAGGLVSTVAGGESNTTSGTYSTVAGGNLNTADGDYSTAAGGGGNTAGGDYSFAAGRRAKATDTGSFVWGDSTSADIGSYGVNTFTARTTGGARFVSAIDGETGAPTAGVTLAASGGSWSSLSDRNAKEGFRTVDKQALLRRLARVPIERWSYKAQGPSIVHMGPTAQDFSRAFSLGEDNTHIATIDEGGVALAAIQGLYRQNQALQRENRSFRAQLGAQNARLTKLEQVFSTLSR